MNKIITDIFTFIYRFIITFLLQSFYIVINVIIANPINSIIVMIAVVASVWVSSNADIIIYFIFNTFYVIIDILNVLININNILSVILPSFFSFLNLIIRAVWLMITQIAMKDCFPYPTNNPFQDCGFFRSLASIITQTTKTVLDLIEISASLFNALLYAFKDIVCNVELNTLAGVQLLSECLNDTFSLLTFLKWIVLLLPFITTQITGYILSGFNWLFNTFLSFDLFSSYKGFSSPTGLFNTIVRLFNNNTVITMALTKIIYTYLLPIIDMGICYLTNMEQMGACVGNDICHMILGQFPIATLVNTGVGANVLGVWVWFTYFDLSWVCDIIFMMFGSCKCQMFLSPIYNIKVPCVYPHPQPLNPVCLGDYTIFPITERITSLTTNITFSFATKCFLELKKIVELRCGCHGFPSPSGVFVHTCRFVGETICYIEGDRNWNVTCPF
jgi:hypothetical protein